MNTGGPAFPVPVNDAIGHPIHNGMSLRDWFAGMAMQGLATNQETLLANNELVEHFGIDGIDKLQATKAYRLADAMLKEREKQ